MMLGSRIVFFLPDELSVLRKRVLELLETRGVKMDHPKVLKMLDAAGALVDPDAQIVRFPRAFLEAQIREAPKKITLLGRRGKNKVEIPRQDGTFHTRTNTGAQSWIEHDSGVYRGVRISDVRTWARLGDGLENIGFCAFPAPSDVPEATADVHALRAMLQSTEKHVWVQPYTEGSVAYLVALCMAVAGGEDALKGSPPVSFIACSMTPLEFKRMDLEVILQCARHGIPLHLCSLPAAGTTAPITMPGAVILCTAEIMAMLATAQVIRPGIPIIATPLIFSTDMTTGRSLQASTESIWGSALAVQFIKAAFGIPTHTYGIGSDAPVMDGQGMSEGALRGVLIGLSGADILGGAGQIEVATSISPVQLVIDNEVLGMVRRLISRTAIDDETMAWKDILSASPGSQFLTGDHTYRHCRDGLMPVNFVRLTRESWEEKGHRDLVARAAQLCRDLLARARPVSLDEDVVEEMDRIVRRADAHLAS